MKKKTNHLSLTLKSQRTAMTNLTYPTRSNQLNPMVTTQTSQTCLKMTVLKKSRVNQKTRKKTNYQSLTLKSHRMAMTNPTYPMRRNQMNLMEKTQTSQTRLKMMAL